MDRWTEIRRRVHNRHRMRVRLIAFVALAGLVGSAPVRAQSPPRRDTPTFLLGVEGQYGAPQGGAGGLAFFIPIEKWHCEDGLCGGHGIQVRTRAGTSGWQVASGPVLMAFPLWADLLLTCTRTAATPRGASPDSTYLGVEGGFAFPVYAVHKRFLSVRPSIGIAHRVEGPAEQERTTFTWSIGAHFVWPIF
jgi:hypothetical protein